MTPAIVALLNERAREKLLCTLNMRKSQNPVTPAAQLQARRADPMS
jgi:hypothetical protein